MFILNISFSLWYLYCITDSYRCRLKMVKSNTIKNNTFHIDKKIDMQSLKRLETHVANVAIKHYAITIYLLGV